MQYAIIAPALDCQPLALTDQVYESARSAKDGLLAALGMEEKFNLVMENYAEFENDLLRLTSSHVLFPSERWS
jgi:hypothetical protein